MDFEAWRSFARSPFRFGTAFGRAFALEGFPFSLAMESSEDNTRFSIGMRIPSIARDGFSAMARAGNMAATANDIHDIDFMIVSSCILCLMKRVDDLEETVHWNS